MITRVAHRLRKAGRSVLPRRVRHLQKNEDGTTAVEFALVAAPFLALMLGILETALIFFGGQLLESGVSESGRLIRTGQAQQQGFSAQDFKESVCAHVMAMFDCEGGLVLEVRKYTTFDSINMSPPIDENGNLVDDEVYQPGKGGDIVVIRAFYKWPTYVHILGIDFSNMAGGYHLLASTAAFKNEPFPW